MQTQLEVKEEEVSQQTLRLTELSAQHVDLLATSQAQEDFVQNLHNELKTSSAVTKQLQTLLDDKDTQLYDAQCEFEKTTGSHAELETQFTVQTAELVTMSEQSSKFETEMEKLQHDLEVAAFNGQQLQSSFDAQQAQATEQVSGLRIEVQQLQVQHCLPELCHSSGCARRTLCTHCKLLEPKLVALRVSHNLGTC